MILLSFPTVHQPAYVNPDHVTHIEQVGTSDNQRSKIYFVGGKELEVTDTAASVSLRLVDRQ